MCIEVGAGGYSNKGSAWLDPRYLTLYVCNPFLKLCHKLPTISAQISKNEAILTYGLQTVFFVFVSDGQR